MAYIANIGDTRAILLTKEGSERLSYDHKATDANEQERIK